MQKKGNTGKRRRPTPTGKHRGTQGQCAEEGPGTQATNDPKSGRRRIQGKITLSNPFNIFTDEFYSVQALIIEEDKILLVLLVLLSVVLLKLI